MDTSPDGFSFDPDDLKWEPPPSLLSEGAFQVDLTPEEQAAILELDIGTTLTKEDIAAAENDTWTGEGITDVDLGKRLPEVTKAKPVSAEALQALLEKSDVEFTAAVTSGIDGAAAAYADQKFQGLMTQVYARLLSHDLKFKDIPQAVRDVFTGEALADVVSVSFKDAIKDVSLGTLQNAADLYDRINTVLVSAYPQFVQTSERFSIVARNITLRVMTIKGKIEKMTFKIARKWIIRIIKILAFVSHIVLWILKWVLKVAAIILGKAVGWALKPTIPTIAAALSPLLLLSSREVKTDIAPMTDAEAHDIHERIERLRLCSWKYVGKPQTHFGPMAEEFAETFDGIVTPEVPGTIHLGDAVFLLVAEVQRQSRENQMLTARIEALERK